MAKRPTRAAAAAKRPAADKKRTTTKLAADKAASRAGKRGNEVAPGSKGRVAAAVRPESANGKAPLAEAKTSSAKGKTAKSKPTTAKAHAASARGAAAPERGAKAKAKAKRPTKLIPPYLAAELGQPLDHEGEPIGAGSRAAFADTELQKYTLQLWQQMQSRRGVNLHLPAMERAGVTIDQIWTTGVTDRLTTSSTDDEVRRYRQRLLFRANLLESILTETVSELNRLNSVEPKPSVGESG